MYKSFSSRWRSEDTYENTYLYTMYQGFFKSWTSEATHFACTHCSKDVYQTVHLMGPCAQRQTLFLNLEIWSYIWKCFASRQCSKALSLNIWSSIWEHTREKHLYIMSKSFFSCCSSGESNEKNNQDRNHLLVYNR